MHIHEFRYVIMQDYRPSLVPLSFISTLLLYSTNLSLLVVKLKSAAFKKICNMDYKKVS